METAVVEKFLGGAMLASFGAGTFCTGLALSALHLSPLSVTVPSSDFATWGAGIIGAVLGSLIGGGISIAGTAYFNRAEARRADVARAYNVIQTAAGMHSDLVNTIDYIQRQIFEKRHLILAGGDLWTAVNPQAGAFVPSRFDPGDLAIIISSRDYRLHSHLIELEKGHQTVMEGWSTFCATRRELRDFMTVSGKSGRIIMSKIDADKNPQAVLRIEEIRSLIESMLETAPQILLASQKTLALLGPSLKKQFKDPHFPSAEVAAKSAFGLSMVPLLEVQSLLYLRK